MELVSIGIPAYNNSEGLCKTLDCILNQSYKNLEIIISNDCSPDIRMDSIIKEYQERDSRIIYFKQDVNKGGFFNFKFVLDNATGQFFMWAADDDEWEPSYIEKCMNHLLIDKNLSLVFSKFTVKSDIDIYKKHYNFNKILISKKKVEKFLLLDECLSHKANMLYGLWIREDALKIFNIAIERKLDSSSMAYGFDNAFLTLTLEFVNSYQVDEVLFHKKYTGRLIPGSNKSLFYSYLINSKRFIFHPIKHFKQSLIDSRNYITRINYILNEPKSFRWRFILFYKRLKYIYFRYIL